VGKLGGGRAIWGGKKRGAYGKKKAHGIQGEVNKTRTVKTF